jgi:hypothetical protein
MATKKKALQAAAGAAGAGEPVYIDSLFSTYLYTGNNSTQTITNGIDLDGEGGMVWIKSRTVARSPYIYDTERGVQKHLVPSMTNNESTNSTGLTAFNTDGWSMSDLAELNATDDYASWTFRKAPGFFDVVTYTGNGDAGGQTISHNLGCVPGMIIVKRYDGGTEHWNVYHKSMGNNGLAYLSSTSTYFTPNTNWNNTTPTSTTFDVRNSSVNQSGGSFVAYLFADGDDADAQIFGTDGDQAVVKCGSYTGNGSTTGPEIDCGFEPQFILLKAIAGDANDLEWIILDTMRGVTTGGADAKLFVQYYTENGYGFTSSNVDITATGFKLTTSERGFNFSGGTYIYIAIRRPMKTPESGTEVFALARGDSTEPNYNSTFPVDAALWKQPAYTGSTFFQSRLTGDKYLLTDSTAAEASLARAKFDFMDGWDSGGLNDTYQSWMFKRATGFFDVVCYEGTGSAMTVNHNLGVVPEMMIVKNRDTISNWRVYASALGATKHILLDKVNAVDTDSSDWNDTEPTDSVFTVGSLLATNKAGSSFVAYLFASLPGISKIGSYTGNGTSQTIDCGFSNGARFVLIKCTSLSGHWIAFDTVRGIVAGNDTKSYFSYEAADVTNGDYVDPDASGFAVASDADTNGSGRTYIYLAIA